MRAWKWHEWLGAIAILVFVLWLVLRPVEKPTPILPPPPVTPSQPAPTPPAKPTAAEGLLSGYGDPASPPIDDLRKLNRVLGGYFSVIKEPSKNPIGGNADLAAALRGENPNRTVFLPAGHPVFSPDGLLLDRWGSPVIVHPEGWQRIELRSAGPDKVPYNGDDLILSATGLQKNP
ncbi:hypothetical protein [Luteolibacter sp. LG18]|uniref:hypothetical protein n=1 Tax=Luteolibacter sp. LG18 TaxID=2819286 RepID=UPI002B2DD559|nr:hypothetical protein llg_45700 [Luteolibacter sp. LG18]